VSLARASYDTTGDASDVSTSSWQSRCAMTAAPVGAWYDVKLRRAGVSARRASVDTGRALPQHAHGRAVQLRRLRQHLVHEQDTAVLHRGQLLRACGHGPRSRPDAHCRAQQRPLCLRYRERPRSQQREYAKLCGRRRTTNDVIVTQRRREDHRDARGTALMRSLTWQRLPFQTLPRRSAVTVPLFRRGKAPRPLHRTCTPLAVDSSAHCLRNDVRFTGSCGVRRAGTCRCAHHG